MSKRLEAMQKRQVELKDLLDEYDDQIVERGSDLDEPEQRAYDAAAEELTTVIETIGELTEREARIAEANKLSVATGERTEKRQSDDASSPYTADGEHNELADMLRREQGDPDAAARLQVHERDPHALKVRATTTGDLGGLVVPKYAVDDYAKIVREKRPFADTLTSRRLTHLTTIIPRQTAGVEIGTSGSGGSETGAFPSNDIEADDDLTVTARRLAGVAEVGQMGLDFSAIDAPSVYAEMFEVYAERLNYRLWHGTGLNGQHRGVFNTSGLGGSDGSDLESFAAYWAAINSAKWQVHAAIKASATHVAMSSARWAMLSGALDTSGRPLLGFGYSAPQNVGGEGDRPSFCGLPVVVDDSIIEGGLPANDTNVVVYSAPELRLWEQNNGVPTTIKADQPKADHGVVQFIAYGYSAFTAERRPQAVHVIEDLPLPVEMLPALPVEPEPDPG